MTEQEKLQYKILSWMAEPNVRGNVNLEESAIDAYFFNEDRKLYGLVKYVLIEHKAIDRISSRGNWAITVEGVLALNRLQNIIDEEKASLKDEVIQESVENTNAALAHSDRIQLGIGVIALVSLVAFCFQIAISTYQNYEIVNQNILLKIQLEQQVKESKVKQYKSKNAQPKSHIEPIHK